MAMASNEADTVEEEVEIDTLHLGDFLPPAHLLAAGKAAWNAFVARYDSREAAGEAIYTALFEAAPSLRNLFTTPKAVQAVKFMVAFQNIVSIMGDASSLRALVETLGFQHMHLEVTLPRVIVFRDAILDMLEVELAEKVTLEARQALTALLNYIGGALIYVRTQHSSRLTILLESWKQVNLKKADKPLQTLLGQEGGGSGSLEGVLALTNGDAHGGKQSPKSVKDASPHGSKDGSLDMSPESPLVRGLPTSFADMFQINAAVMGFGKSATTWMNDVLDSFDALVVNAANGAREQEECDVLTLRLSKYPQGSVKLGEFKACMLAALRSMLPKDWTTAHEEAWTWLWANVASMIQTNMGNPPLYEKALEKVVGTIEGERLAELCRGIYNKFFELAPAGQDYFKQSSTRLHFIAGRIVEMTLELYRAPKKLVSEISALGLRHVGFGIPTELFSPFVTASVEVLRMYTQDDMVMDAFRWSLNLIAKILVRTIIEGSTVVMKAINANSAKQLRKAIGCAPRSERAQWLLDVQVGDQHISPLSWAIGSGSLKVAEVMLRDLLTIRADRARYYYGADELFGRHGDIVRRLCEEAPLLLPTLLDGLIWRSHRTKGGLRRVNYYVKHMLIAADGSFSDSVKWISASGDPSIVSHPVVAFLVDTLWSGVVLRQFILSRVWNIMSLVVFILVQEILPGYNAGVSSRTVSALIFAGRVFNYVVGMGRLACFHLWRIWLWSRNTMRRIIEEIDTDGNGTIEYVEMVEALMKFRQTVAEEIRKAVRILREDDELGASEEARKAIANKEKNMYNLISMTLMALLAVMCTHEPMFWCPLDDGWPTEECEGVDELRYRYSVFGMCAMAVHWLILIDLAVFSTDVSAFLLVCGHVLSEVKQFLTALAFLLLTFGSILTILCRNCPQTGGKFGDLGNAVLTLFAISIGFYQGDFRKFAEEPLLLGTVLLFLLLSVVLLLNLLIAQLNRSYEYINQDMLGFARLNRASLIVDAMESCPQARWVRFVESLRFDEKLEFDEGDLGLPGGMQIWEPANLHRQTVETIRRFGGTTSPKMPWPEDRNQVVLEDGEDRLERIEGLVQKALKRIAKARKGRPGHGSSAGGSQSRQQSAASAASASTGSGSEGKE